MGKGYDLGDEIVNCYLAKLPKLGSRLRSHSNPYWYQYLTVLLPPPPISGNRNFWLSTFRYVYFRAFHTHTTQNKTPPHPTSLSLPVPTTSSLSQSLTRAHHKHAVLAPTHCKGWCQMVPLSRSLISNLYFSVSPRCVLRYRKVLWKV